MYRGAGSNSYNGFNGRFVAPRRGRGRASLNRAQINNSSQDRYGSCRNRNNNTGTMSYRTNRRPINVFEELETFLEREPSDLLLSLTSREIKLTKILSTNNLKHSQMLLVLKLLNKACTCNSSPHNLTNFLLSLNDSPFMSVNNLSEHIAGLDSHQDDIPVFLESLLNILKCRLEKCPNTRDSVLPVIATIEYMVNNSLIIKSSCTTVIESLLIDIKLLLDTQKTVTLENQFEQLSVEENVKVESDKTVPPNDYRELSVLPQEEDIEETNPFLRSNRSYGSFKDVDQYLDIQFRLLREDFIEPLRSGINEFIQMGEKAFSSQDVRLYSGVHILNPICTKEGIVHRICFDNSNLKRVRWDSSKRLIFGSLVCLSKDNFVTTFFASVCNRDPKKLSIGELEIKFEQDHNKVFKITPAEVFLMLETTAYFESYRHVLNCLKNKTINNFPFQNYIVKCNTDVNAPRYFLNGINNKYNLNLASAKFKHEFTNIPVLDYKKWPSAEMLGLDDSQYRALQTALTKEFAIIQGPPGTGKTFIGLKIVELLLQNLNYMLKESPILIICYTNHALDQFLEGIQKIHNSGIIRVGGRSKSTALEPFFIRNVRSRLKKSREFPKFLNGAHYKIFTEIKDIEKRIDEAVTTSNTTERGILHENVLGEFIKEKHFKQILSLKGQKYDDRNSNSSIIEWLCLAVSKSEDTLNIITKEDKNDLQNEEILNEYEHLLNRFQNRREQEQRKTNLKKKEKRAAQQLTVNLSDFKVDSGQPERDIEMTKYLSEQILSQINSEDIMSVDDENLTGNLLSLNGSRRWDLYRLWVSRYQENLKELFLTDMESYYNVRTYEKNKNINYAIILDLETRMDEFSVKLKTIKYGILHDKYLSSFIVPAHYRQILEMNGNYSSDASILDQFQGFTESFLTNWLILDNDVIQLEVYNEIDYDSEDEADFARGQRTLEEEEFTNQRQKREQELYRKQIEQKASEMLAFNLSKNEHENCHSEFEISRGQKKRIKKKISKELKSDKIMTRTEEDAIENILKLDSTDKWKLYRLWVSRYRAKVKNAIFNDEQEYEECCLRLKELKAQEDKYIMSRSKIIGMTTTGAAKYNSVLQEIMPRIVIVEEAAEVLEAHIIASLSESCQHLILIGDHKQLRPSPTVYRLAKQFKLDISLFERMVNNKMECMTLNTQHRMRPEISEVISTIYDGLKDHQSVETYDKIKGIKSNIFFVDHSTHEKQDDELKSKSNSFEADYLFSLCKYLLLQGYKPSQITILTPYVGQIFEIRRAMPKYSYKQIRVCCVDNFQGEENDIILMSYVRSNSKMKLGFLDIDNRVCVSLSRARQGFFAIGNFTMFAEKSKLWRNVVEILRRSNSIGESLPLYCQNHPQTGVNASVPDDFKKAPEGGCTVPCEARLKCGHTCPKVCHTLDPDHIQLKCRKKCEKKNICKRGHPCGKLCFETCTPCLTEVTKVLTCLHQIKVSCHNYEKQDFCYNVCSKLLNCGHLCQMICSEPHDHNTINCTELVECQLSCGHTITKKCSEKIDDIKCQEPCNTFLICDHVCRGTCGRCLQGRVHISCQEKCQRILVCGHRCKDLCSKMCPPCSSECKNRCSHSSCKEKCGVLCQVCTEPCLRKCKHAECKERCFEQCKKPPCNYPCTQTFICRKCKQEQLCIGLCGEICPKLCSACDREKYTDIFFGTEDELDARFVCLEDCGHVLEVSGLDQWMKTKDDGKDSIQLKSCPKCNTPIRKNDRYRHIINQSLLDIERVKEKIFGEFGTNQHLIQKIRNEIQSLREKDYKSAEPLLYILDRLNDPNVNQIILNFYENQISIHKNISNLNLSLLKNSDATLNSQVLGNVSNDIRSLSRWVSQSQEHVRLGEQQINELTLEISRLSLILDFLKLGEIINNNDRTSLLSKRIYDILNELDNQKPLTQEEESRLQQLYQELKKKAGSFGITNEERMEILKAMNLSRGHWFKCPNGHVYAIGECGGATVEGKCPECKASIGGTHHRLRSDNAVATEMDGAKFGAYSEQANMQNYNFNEFM